MKMHNKNLFIMGCMYFILQTLNGYSSPIFIAASYAAIKKSNRREFHYLEKKKEMLAKEAQNKIDVVSDQCLKKIEKFYPREIYKDLYLNKKYLDKELKSKLKKLKKDMTQKNDSINTYYKTLKRLLRLDNIEYEIRILNFYIKESKKIEDEYKSKLLGGFYDFDEISSYYIKPRTLEIENKIYYTQKYLELFDSIQKDIKEKKLLQK